MSRLIDADALKQEIHLWYSDDLEILEHIDAQPTIQPEPHWIPVTDGLPKESGVYDVTTTHGKVATYVFSTDSISSHEYWKRCVIAWKSRPEPYKEVTE